MKRKLIIGLILLTGVVSTLSPALLAESTYASDARSFNAGRIIDDSVFTNSSSMSVQDIQNFFNSKVNCDTWGTKQSELGGGTRAQWLSARGISTPVKCVTDYYENPSTGQNNYGTTTNPAGSISAAQIIYNYARQFNINPQVIIVTLQKENGLITDEWPTPRQYTQAMGFGCPDNVAPGAPACDSTYGSFSAQIYQAARHFRGFFDNQAGWYIPFTTGVNQIMWNVASTGCGSGPVNIQNRATVALYSYTPYQPNQAALNAQYGYGDGCSAYGNRNFYLYFTDWFSSTYGSVLITSPLNVTSSEGPMGFYTQRSVNVSFDIQNTMSSSQNIGDMMTAVRDSQGNNYDFGRQSIVLNPGQTYHYSASQVFNNEETYSFSIANYQSAYGWSTNFPASSNTSLTRSVNGVFIQALPTVAQSPTPSNELRVGKATPVTFSIKNNSTRALTLGSVGISVRDEQNNNLDLPYASVTNLSAGSTYSYSQNFIPPKTGKYTFGIAITPNGGLNWNDSTFPGVSSTSLSTVGTAKPSPSLVTSLSVSPATPKVGQKTTYSYSIKNYGDSPVNAGVLGITLRDSQGNNYDPRWDNVVIQPNSTYTYSVDTYPDSPGTWKAAINGFKNGQWSVDWLPDEGNITRATSVNVGNNPTITSSVSASPAQPRVGQNVTLQYTIRNDGDSAVTTGLTGLSVRDSKGSNLDPGWVTPTIQPHTTYTYSRIVTFMNDGPANISVSGQQNNVWKTNTIPSESQSVSQALQLTILPSPTITQGLTFTDQKVVGNHMISFTINNYGDSTVNLGKMGIIVRDPQGRNYDPLWQDFSIAANSSKTYTATINFDKSGSWTVEIGNYNGQWNTTNPTSENDQIIRRQQYTIN